MYFNSDMQKRVLLRLHFALSSMGYLMLGQAEMLLTHTNLFTPADLRRRVFNKVTHTRMRDTMLMLTANPHEEVMTTPAVDVRLRMLVFDANPVAQIVLDAKGNLFMMNERAQALFGLVSRDVGRPVQDFDVFYRPVALRPVLTQIQVESRMIAFKEVFWPTAAGENHWYDVQVIPMIDSHRTMLGTLLMYNDVTQMKRLHDQLEQINRELETAYEELQSTNEEMETTNEELQSTVEELETTNEELHSTNEEMETINEELQSTNEELETLNNELRRRSDELYQSNQLTDAIFANLPSAVVVLDRDQLVKVWSQRAEDLWGLRAEEALGQHFMNLDIGLPTEQLKQPIRACLSGDAPIRNTFITATNRRGKTIPCKVTCLPLRNTPDVVSGIIVVMEEQEA